MLMISPKHWMHTSNPIQNPIRHHITSIRSAPHLLHQPMITPGQSHFSLLLLLLLLTNRRRLLLIVLLLQLLLMLCLNNVTAIQKISRQRWRIAERLQCSIHITSIGNILQANQTADRIHCGRRWWGGRRRRRSMITARQIIVTAVITTTAATATSMWLRIARIVTDQWDASLLMVRMGHYGGRRRNKHFRFANITPNALRRQIHVQTMRLIGTKMFRTVIVVLFRASDVLAWFVQTNPQILADRCTLWAWQTLHTHKKKTIFK